MNVLVINTSLAGEQSATRSLVSTFLAKRAATGHDVIVERDLVTTPIPHLAPQLVAVQLGLTPGVDVPGADLAEKLIEELEAADLIVLGLPMYNFTVPSSFKAWLDYVVRAGRTFSYEGGAPKGLLPPGKRVIAFVASGGVYASGPAQGLDFVEPYLRAILGFIGISDVIVLRAEAQAVPDLRDAFRARAVAEAETLAEAA